MGAYVLIVDDDEWQAEYLAQQLAGEGYKTMISLHASQALAQIDARQPQCIILDIGLPGINGVTLLHELHSHEDLRQIPVVICSNLSLALDEVCNYGVVAVLSKSSMNHGDIVAVVRKALASE